MIIFFLKNRREVLGSPCCLLPPCLYLGKTLCYPTPPPENLPVQEHPWFMFPLCVLRSRLCRAAHRAPQCTGSGKVDPTAGGKWEQPRASSGFSLTLRHGWSMQQRERAPCPDGLRSQVQGCYPLKYSMSGWSEHLGVKIIQGVL